jgi:hypothetical protein
MELFVYQKKANNLYQIRKLKNFYPENYNMIRDCEYWFVLHSGKDIIAECSVCLHYCYWNWFRKITNTTYKYNYTISDVLVYQPYRGNDYCSLLLLNVMYWFVKQKSDCLEDLHFKLYADFYNRSARRAYQKIFGYKGDRISSRLISFSTREF